MEGDRVMKLHELQKQIISKELDKIYLFTGSEVGIMDIYLDKMKSATGCEVLRYDFVHEAYSKMVQRSISGEPKILIVRDDKEFLKDEKAWDKVLKNSNSSHYLILIYTALDKRSKFYKQHIDMITEFEKLDADMLSKYVLKELPGMRPGNAVRLAKVCECDYSRILLECDKVKQYALANDDNYDTAFEILLQDGIIFQPIGDITFKFTDSILLRDYANTAKYLLEARQKQEPEVMVLSILYSGFKQILMVQGLGDDKSDAVNRTGLTAWQVKMAKEKMGHYKITELINALKVIRFVETAIKTGQLDAEASLEYTIINIM